MPVEQRSLFQPLRAVLIAGIGVAMAVGVMFAMVWATDRNNEVLDFQLGDDRFNAGIATNQAEAIERDGPILYPDLVGKNRPIWVNHLGPSAQEGWVAFDAKAPGTDEGCLLEWNAEGSVFVDSCDPTIVVLADGEDQIHYPVSVNDQDEIVIDLNRVGDEDDEGADS